MYRTVDTATWTDPKIKLLDPDGKLLFLYLFTNQHSHVSGIYYLTIPTILHETGIKKGVLKRRLDTLSELGLARFDPENEVIWVEKMFFYQGRGEKNLRAASKQLESLHNSYLIKGFLDEYPMVREFISERITVKLDRVSEVGTPNQEQEQEQEQEKKSAASPQTDLAPAPVFLSIPTNKNGEEFSVSEAKVREYQETYPAVDVKAQIREARQWCIDNPAKRKTTRGIPAFLNRWLAKEQNRGGGRFTPGVTANESETVADIEARAKKGRPDYDAK